MPNIPHSAAPKPYITIPDRRGRGCAGVICDPVFVLIDASELTSHLNFPHLDETNTAIRKFGPVLALTPS